MYALVKTGGKQYKVFKDDVISVEKILGKPGERVEISNVLMVGGAGEKLEVGAPVIEKACVIAEILEQGKGEKVIVFKKRRRHNYRRKRGHRQELTLLKVLEVSKTGKPTKVAAKKSNTEQTDNKTESKAAEQKVDPKTKTEKKAPSKKISSKKAGSSTIKNTAEKTAAKKPVAKKAPPQKRETTEGDKE